MNESPLSQQDGSEVAGLAALAAGSPDVSSAWLPGPRTFLGCWEHGARWDVGHEGVRQLEIGRRAFEASREEAEYLTRFLVIVRRGEAAITGGTA